MNGKDLLAVLAMIIPSCLLIALIAFTLVSPGVTDSPSGSAFARDDDRKAPGPLADTGNAHAMGVDPAGDEPRPATQKRMRNPWEKPSYAKNLKASAH